MGYHAYERGCLTCASTLFGSKGSVVGWTSSSERSEAGLEALGEGKVQVLKRDTCLSRCWLVALRWEEDFLGCEGFEFVAGVFLTGMLSLQVVLQVFKRVHIHPSMLPCHLDSPLRTAAESWCSKLRVRPRTRWCAGCCDLTCVCEQMSVQIL